MTLISDGETSCLALSNILNDKKITNVIAVDERTTRLLCEDPIALKKLFQKRFHTGINYKKENQKFLGNFKFIRSAELVYVINQKELTSLKDPRTLDAMIWAVRFKGCYISDDEIREIVSLGRKH